MEQEQPLIGARCGREIRMRIAPGTVRRGLGEVVTLALKDLHALPSRLSHQPLHECSLSDPGLARDENQTAAPVAQGRETLAQTPPLSGTPDKRSGKGPGRCAGRYLRRHRGRLDADHAPIVTTTMNPGMLAVNVLPEHLDPETLEQ